MGMRKSFDMPMNITCYQMDIYLLSKGELTIS